MEALGDYLSHKSKGKEFCPDLVLKYTRKYAEVCRKKNMSEKILEEAKKARRSYDVGVRLKKLIDYGGYIL